MDDGILSEFFDLERGNAQGDTISPFLFNLGYQLLLFKLELYLQIEGTQGDIAESLNINAGEREPEGVNPRNFQEVRSSDPKATAMADDCTLVVRLELQNLQIVIGILREFENFTGLGCNLEKTTLMQVGSTDPIPDEILNLGLTISDEITLLGAKIKNTRSCFEGNGTVILEK